MNEVRDVLSEAGSTVDQLREQLRVSEVRCNELFAYGQFMERQLIEAKAELSRVGAELSSQQLTFQEINAALQECQSSNNALMFQLNQTRVESQIKDREIQRLRSAAPCASTSGSPPKPPKSQPRLLVFSGTFVPPPVSSCQVPSQSTSPVSDPRVDQLIEMVQQMVQQVGQNAVDPGETNDDDDGDDEEAVKELREKDIVD
eukprot:s273_g18.t1